MIDQEWTTRKNNHMNRLMKGAGFTVPGACVENIEYVPERKLDKNLITTLSTCNYIREHHNVILLGPTGSGKTYIGCALGVSAVRNFMKVKYVRLPELLTELAIARASNTFPKVIQQYQNHQLKNVFKMGFLTVPQPIFESFMCHSKVSGCKKVICQVLQIIIL